MSSLARSAAAGGSPPTVICVDSPDATGTLLTLLSQRPAALAGQLCFTSFRAAASSDLTGEFWEQLPEAAGVALSVDSTGSIVDLSLVATIAASETRLGCPILARVSDLTPPIVVWQFLHFYWKIREIENAGVDVWIDGDIDRMSVRARNVGLLKWKTRYPPTSDSIERSLDDFLEKSLRHHADLWAPMPVHLTIRFC